MVLLAGCGPRSVEVIFYTPESCALRADDAGVAPPCPLAAVRSIETRLERVDGTAAETQCVDAPDGICVLDDLGELVFLTRAAPNDGVEIQITGWTSRGCRDGTLGVLALRCETFGTSVIDLAEVDEVPVWCDCPYITDP